MKSMAVASLGLLCLLQAQAQAPVQRFPFANVGGQPIQAHYVRLEGGSPNVNRPTLLLNQRLCAELGLRAAPLPPEGTLLTRTTVERYYTPSHLIDYRFTARLGYTAACALEWSPATLAELKVHSPRGVCTLDLRRREAFGACGDSRGPVLPEPALRVNYERLGVDGELGCENKLVDMHGIRVQRCVEPRPVSEMWHSYLYIGGPSMRGLLLAERSTDVSSNEVMDEVRAVEVRRNITVGSDMLDLARTQGFSITSPGGRDRGTR